MRKIRRLVAVCLMLTLLGTVTAYAGQWQKDSVGWWYLNDDHTYPAGGWQLIDEKWYCFDDAGYMLHDTWAGDYYVGSSGAMLIDTTTPDGYYVGTDGKWTGNSTDAGTSAGNDAGTSGGSGRDLSYADLLRSNPSLINKYGGGWYEVVLLLDDAHIIDRGDCYEVTAVNIRPSVEFATKEEAQKVTDSSGFWNEIVQNSNGTYSVYGEDAERYTYHLWGGSMYIRKDAIVYYIDDGQKKTTVSGVVSGISAPYGETHDCVIESIDSEGYITVLRRIQWG